MIKAIKPRCISSTIPFLHVPVGVLGRNLLIFKCTLGAKRMHLPLMISMINLNSVYDILKLYLIKPV